MPHPRRVVEGVDDAGNKESDSRASGGESDGPDTSDDSDEDSSESDSDDHPPAGGQKNPRKKKPKAKTKGKMSTKAIKKIKAGEETDLLKQLADARGKTTKEKWKYIMHLAQYRPPLKGCKIIEILRFVMFGQLNIGNLIIPLYKLVPQRLWVMKVVERRDDEDRKLAATKEENRKEEQARKDLLEDKR
jgi:hypothetical protein